MRILYIAKHDKQDADDEGAISYALEQLGHIVIKAPEQVKRTRWNWPECDLVLFHHWHYPEALESIGSRVPKICWCFDLIDSSICCSNDTSLLPRDRARRNWFNQVAPRVDLMFMTDGDWVVNCPKEWGKDKLVWLMQGFDERLYQSLDCEHGQPTQEIDLLFLGIGVGGGRGRELWVKEMKDTYTDRFVHVNRGVYREDMRMLIRRSKIVLAPDSPVSDRYWSNRVYNTLGCGGFLLHPYSEGLHRQYEYGVVYYKDREDLHYLIHTYLGVLKGCTRQSLDSGLPRLGLKRTMECHTYKYRVEEMLFIIQKILGVGRDEYRVAQ